MKRLFLNTISFLMAAALLGGALIVAWSYHLYKAPAERTGEETFFLIERGDTLRSIARNLSAEDLISNETVFRMSARFRGLESRFQAGEYKIPPQATMETLQNLFVSGKTFSRQITIPEGLTSWQIVQIINQVPAMKGEIADIPAEGTLLPETYAYQRTDTREGLIARMQENMTAAIDGLWDGRVRGLPFDSKEEAIVLASIVEKETAVAAERAKVAGVFINRLHKGMKLQSDPTVIYALTNGQIQNTGQGPLGRRLLRKDLTIPSPYNTYANEGLPPAPIANPGLASMASVLNPEEHDYLYFVADGTGGHVFAKTLKEHNNNVNKWRKIRRQQAQ